MGYRSDVRIITSKKGFEELTGFVKKYLGEGYKYNLLDSLEINEDRGDQIYFGWNYLKWYDGFAGYENVTAIEEGLEHLAESGYGYRFARLGENYDDYEELNDDGDNEDWLDWIYVTRKFDDEEVV